MTRQIVTVLPRSGLGFNCPSMGWPKFVTLVPKFMGKKVRYQGGRTVRQPWDLTWTFCH
jgi:hypothetical protein